MRPKPVAPAGGQPATSIIHQPAASVVEFEYLGSGAVAVFGPVTGRLYRFDVQGRRRLAVDLRDRPSLAVIPGLREVR